jgi:hypothetical protein
MFAALCICCQVSPSTEEDRRVDCPQVRRYCRRLLHRRLPHPTVYSAAILLGTEARSPSYAPDSAIAHETVDVDSR